jgi:hypothetical protein
LPKTRSHNAATNCYRFMDTEAGNLCRQLRATRVNFSAAGRSALGILLGKNTKCRGGRIPHCATAARQDGSMTLMHVCAAGDPPVCGLRLHAGPTRRTLVPFRLSSTFLRLPAQHTPVGVRRVHNLLISANVRFVDEIRSPEELPWEAAGQLGTRDGVSVLNVEEAVQPGRTNN